MIFTFNDYEYAAEPQFDPELIDERLLALLTPSIPFSKERHQIIFKCGVGYIV
jgi:hypothetical protein